MPVVSSHISLLRKLYQYTTMGMVSDFDRYCSGHAEKEAKLRGVEVKEE